jgi:hypothetical protein
VATQTIRIRISNIVWQKIFITMKILKVLREQEETNQQIIYGGTFGFTKDALDTIEEDIKRLGSFEFSNITIPYPGGGYKVIPNLYINRKGDVDLNLSVKIYLVLDRLEIPTDFITFITKWLTDKFKEKVPVMSKKIYDDHYHQGAISFNIREIYVSYKDLFFSLNEYMDVAYYNSHVMKMYPLEKVMKEENIPTYYNLDPTQVPTFDDNFSLAMDKVTKKMKSIYQGFRRGTFRGRQYEFKENNPRISVLIEDREFDPTTKVLHPKFRLSMNAGYPHIDGTPTSSFEPPETRFPDVRFVEDFNHYIKSRFEQFGIKLL